MHCFHWLVGDGWELVTSVVVKVPLIGRRSGPEGGVQSCHRTAEIVVGGRLRALRLGGGTRSSHRRGAGGGAGDGDG